MDEIVASVKRVTDIMSEIAAASAEQSSGIDQVNQAIVNMDEVTQQNAALVEEAAAASESLEEQAAALAETVAQFRLDRGASQVVARHNAALATARKLPAIKVTKGVTRTRTEAKSPRSAKPAAIPAAPTDDDWTEF
jgi:uncharacterized phage infection (PIP) family protein YhgE